MKYVVPLSNPDNYESLVEAGAGGFFSGFIPYEWIEKYCAIFPLNRREWFLGGYNTHTVDTMKILNKKMEKLKVPVNLTFNGKYYIPEQYTLILKLINRLMDIGFSSFIISDLGLILYLREHNVNCRIHLSGVTALRNSHAISFFRQFNIDRYIFGRKISIENMHSIVDHNKDLEFEAFFLNERCLFSEEYCNGVLCDRLCTTCTMKYKLDWPESSRLAPVKHKLKIQRKLMSINPNNAENIRKSDESLAIRGCGLCAYRELEQAGITHLKIVGRMLDHNKIIEDIRIAKEISEIDIKNAGEFSTYVREKYFGNKCPTACYYLKNGKEAGK